MLLDLFGGCYELSSACIVFVYGKLGTLANGGGFSAYDGQIAFRCIQCRNQSYDCTSDGIKVMDEINIDISKHHSKDLSQFVGQTFDYIITVCDRARDNCPTFPGDVERIHWSFDDPASATGSEIERLACFRRIRGEIRNRILSWYPTVLKKLGDAGVKISTT